MKSDPIRIIDNSSMLQNTVIASATETLALASQLLATDSYIQGALANGVIYLTPGAGTVSVTITIRRGYGTGGSIAWQSPPIHVEPGVCNAVPVAAVFPCDQYFKGGQYSLTVRCNGATASGSMQYGSVLWAVSSYPWDVPPNVAVVLGYRA